jgi:hypothetical protein
MIVLVEPRLSSVTRVTTYFSRYIWVVCTSIHGCLWVYWGKEKQPARRDYGMKDVVTVVTVKERVG